MKFRQIEKAPQGSVAIVASARQTNEELWLISKLKSKLGAISDSVPRIGEGDKLLVSADKNPNTNGARLTGICFTEMGTICRRSPRNSSGKIKTLIVFGEDVTKHGIGADLLGKLETLIVSDILPNATTKLRIIYCPAARTRKSAARSRTRKAASRNS
jgi:NADH-quinone oxidoreductase subunit G